MEEYKEYDEISLKELIEVLLGGKWWIVTITLVIVLMTGIATFFFMDPVYEAETVLMPSNIERNGNVSIDGDKINEILDQLTIVPSMSLETYKEQIKNNEVLNRTVNALDDLIECNYEGLKNKITVSTSKDSGNITIKASDTDPVLAATIANTLKDEYMKYISEIQQRQLDQSIEFFNEQVEIEKGNLEKALLVYQDFLNNNESAEDIKTELDIKKNSRSVLANQLEKLIRDYEINKLDYELKLKIVLRKIKVTDELLLNESSTYVLKKDVYSDLALNEYFKSLGLDVNDIDVQIEESNPIYYSLKSSINKLIVEKSSVGQSLDNLKIQYEKKSAYLDDTLETLTAEIDEMNVEYYEVKYDERDLLTQVSHAEGTYRALLNKVESTRIAEASKISENSIIVISDAYVPINPVSPNKKLNLAIGLVLGLMVGVFFVFFRSYMKSE